MTNEQKSKVNKDEIEVAFSAYSGMSMEEYRCSQFLTEAFNSFQSLPRQHPNELPEFADAIHKLQGLLALRIVRRDYPQYWPTHNDQ